MYKIIKRNYPRLLQGSKILSWNIIVACVEGVYITYLHMYTFTGENTSKFENHKGKTY